MDGAESADVAEELDEDDGAVLEEESCALGIERGVTA